MITFIEGIHASVWIPLWIAAFIAVLLFHNHNPKDKNQ